MSVATKNPFSLLESEGTSRPSSPAPAAQGSAPPAPGANRTSQKSRGGPASRGGKYYARGGTVKKPGQKDAAPQDNAEEPTAGDGQRRFENRGRGRGGRGGGGRGGGAPTRGRGRQFDRHSGTGKTDSEKKLHQSWGGDDGNTELRTEQQASVDAAVEGSNEWAPDSSAPAADWGTPAADGAAEPAAPDADKAQGGRPRREREPEEDDNTLTLDQYLAKQKEKESAIPKLEGARQANEGADANIWKDVKPLEKDQEDAYFVGKTKSAPKARAKKEEKVYLEIDAHFERNPRGGRGRGRGGDRGFISNRGRGGARGGRQGNPPPVVDVDDQTAFPTLS